jgi:hypothetical protein
MSTVDNCSSSDLAVATYHLMKYVVNIIRPPIRYLYSNTGEQRLTTNDSTM